MAWPDHPRFATFSTNSRGTPLAHVVRGWPAKDFSITSRKDFQRRFGFVQGPRGTKQLAAAAVWKPERPNRAPRAITWRCVDTGCVSSSEPERHRTHLGCKTHSHASVARRRARDARDSNRGTASPNKLLVVRGRFLFPKSRRNSPGWGTCLVIESPPDKCSDDADVCPAGGRGLAL